MKFKQFALLCCLALFSMTVGSVLAQDLATNTPQPQLEATQSPGEVSLTATSAPTTGTSDVSEINVPIPDEVVSDGEGFEIVEMKIERTSHTLEGVTITVENTGEEMLDGVGWYLLAPSYIIEESWRFAAYVAPVELITRLEPGAQTTLTFAGPDVTLIGEYTLSGWIHRVNADGTTTHADGVGYDEPLVIGPDVFLTVDSVDLFPVPDSEGEYLFYVTFTLRNYSALPAEIAYSYTLAAPNEAAPWETGVFSLPFRSLILLPENNLTLTTRDIIAIPPSQSLEVIGYLYEKVEGMLAFRSSYASPDLIEIAG